MKLPIIIVLSFALFLLLLPGCSSTNNQHKAQHIESIKTDMRQMHRDVDSLLMRGSTSSLRPY